LIFHYLSNFLIVTYLNKQWQEIKTCQKLITINRNGAVFLGKALDITPPSGRYEIPLKHAFNAAHKKTPIMTVLAIC